MRVLTLIYGYQLLLIYYWRLFPLSVKTIYLLRHYYKWLLDLLKTAQDNKSDVPYLLLKLLN